MSTTLKKSFPVGTIAKWSVSAENFHTSSGEIYLNGDTTLNIELKDSKIAFEWDGGGTKTVWFGNKPVTSTSPICVGNDGLMTQIDYGSDFSNDSTTKNVFIDAKGLPSNDVYISTIFNFDTNVIENIEIINSSHITEFDNAFKNMKHLKTLIIDTSGATSLRYMFLGNAIDPPYLNTSNVTDVEGMFAKCNNLKNVPPYDFSKVTNMKSTFFICPNITSIPPLDTHNVTSIEYCFSDCTKLKSVPLLDFSNVTNTNLAFYGCTSLTDVGGFIGLKTDIEFKYSPLLTHDSAVNIIDNLAVSPGHTVLFKKATFDTLSPAEIARATDKGWTIQSI